MGISSLGKEAAEDAQSRGGSEFERFDVTGAMWAKSHPTTAVAGTAVALRTFNPQDGTPYGGLVLENPYIVADDGATENTYVFKNTSDKGDDFKIVNADDEATRIMEDGDDDIVLFDGNEFTGQQVDEFGLGDGQYLVLKVTGSTMMQVMRRLDVNGKEAAGVRRDEDGNIVLSKNGFPMQNGGLVEYNDWSDEYEARIARAPILREDVEGREVVILVQRKADVYDDYDGRAYFTTVSAKSDDGEWERVEPTTGEVPLGAIIDTGWLDWSYEPAMKEVESGNVSPAGSETALSTAEVTVIDQIQETVDASDAEFSELSREDLATLVSNNTDQFDPDTDLDTIVDELAGRQ